ncbi:MAG: hypothetical protein ACOZBH_00805 [Patescibacteria group bacterium]
MPRKKITPSEETKPTPAPVAASTAVSAKKKSLVKHPAIPGWFIAGILLIAVVAMFVYAQKSISKVQDEKNEVEGQTRVLKSTVTNLQAELSDLNQKTEDLQATSQKSKEFFFNQEIIKRKIPDSVDTKDWQLYKDDDWTMEMRFPKNWQISKSADQSQPASGDAKAVARKSIALEPIGVSEFVRSLQIMPYDFGQRFSVEEKVKAFESKGILDNQNFNGGKLVYFVEKAENTIVPTIMILSDFGDYKAIFLVSDIYHRNYFDYLTDFENILSAVKLEAKPAAPAETASGDATKNP